MIMIMMMMMMMMMDADDADDDDDNDGDHNHDYNYNYDRDHDLDNFADGNDHGRRPVRRITEFGPANIIVMDFLSIKILTNIIAMPSHPKRIIIVIRLADE